MPMMRLVVVFFETDTVETFIQLAPVLLNRWALIHSVHMH